MQAKPEHFDTSFAEAFKVQAVVDAYRFRPPYPAEVFTLLLGLLHDEPRTILDVGAGAGDLARQLVTHVERVDAVDFSPRMIARGQTLPHGDDPRLHWILGKVEEVPLTPPYALITAGASIHWTDWPLAFPRFNSLLTPSGVLALVHRHVLRMPWSAELRTIQVPFSMRRDHRVTDVSDELTQRGLFQIFGEQETAPIAFTQTLADFLEGVHSRSGYARELMGEDRAADLDKQISKLLLQFHPDGILPLHVVGNIIWGKPLPPPDTSGTK